ncbi:hemerythrin domain-containing protein [Magnetococcales bacterium HHB-1]
MELRHLPAECWLGYQEIDTQHEILFTLFLNISAIHAGEAPLSDLPNALKTMKGYVETHFQFEESLMARSDFPEAKRHLNDHHNFEQAIASFQDRLNRLDPSEWPMVAEKLFLWLFNWLNRHIAVEDRKLCQFFAPMLTPSLIRRDLIDRPGIRNIPKRRHCRVEINVAAHLLFVDHASFSGRAIDISISGIQLSNMEKQILTRMGQTGSLLIELNMDRHSFPLSIPIQVVRAGEEVVGVRFIDLNQENYEVIDRFLKLNGQGESDSVRTQQSRHQFEEYQIQVGILQDELSEHLISVAREIFIAYMGEQVQEISTIEKMDFEDYKPPEAEVTAVVNFSGALEGGIHLASPLHVGLRLASAFAEEEYGTVDQFSNEAYDAFAELANIVAGSMVEHIAHIFEGIHLTPPYIIVQDDYSTHYNRRFGSVKSYFSSKEGPFLIECFYMT